MSASSSQWLPSGDGALLSPYLPADVSWQSYGLQEALHLLKTSPQPQDCIKVLDVGCGGGGSFYEFTDCDRRISWAGLDLLDSPEATGTGVRGLNFRTFDGVHIPCAENEIDLLYSRQVFEHVRHPHELLREMHRVLKPGGHLAGSTSHLEPFSFAKFLELHALWILRAAPRRGIRLRRRQAGNRRTHLNGQEGAQLRPPQPPLRPFF